MKNLHNKYKIVLIAVVLILIGVCVFFTVNTFKTAKKTVTIGISMPNNIQKRWEMDAKNLLRRFDEKNYQTIIKYADDDVYLQIKQLEEMIDEGVNILLITPVQADSLRDLLKKAKSNGVCVIAYDRLITNTTLVDYYVTFKNYDVGMLQAEYIVDKLGLSDKNNSETYNIEIFAGDSEDFNSKYFFKGAMSVLKKYIDSGRLTVRSGETEFNRCTIERWNYKIAANRMRRLLDTYYTDDSVDAVICGNDGLAMGIYGILLEKGYADNMPILTGQDADVDYVKIIKDNDRMMTVFKDTRLLANAAAILIDSLIKGDEPKINNTEDYNNGRKRINTYEVPPISIDRKNYFSLLVGSGYISQESLQ